MFNYIKTTFNYIKRLYDCIKSLGVKNGIRYWRIGNECMNDPEYYREFVKNTEAYALERQKRARKSGEEKDRLEAEVWTDWARVLRGHFEHFVKKNGIKFNDH